MDKVGIMIAALLIGINIGLTIGFEIGWWKCFRAFEKHGKRSSP